MSLGPGTCLGPYEILAALGAGGMGEVYRARDSRLDREVAIKVLPPHLAGDPQLIQRFQREARAVSSLNHPHICTLHDVGEENGVHFLVMELLEGETLAQRLEKGALSVEQALTVATQVADALDKAHRHSLIHRDLKPGNIMLTGDGAKLLDFGLAKNLAETSPALSTLPTRAGPLTAQGSIVGTFQYMSPEQMEGQEADARSDIFSFGIVLFEMLTGRKAFAGKSQAGLLVAIMEHDPPPVATLEPRVPPALDRLVQRCLSKAPDERWQTMSDLASELAWIAAAGSRAGVAAPVVWRRRSRQRLWMTATAVFGLATAGLLARLFLVTPPLPPVTRSFIPAPPGTHFRAAGRTAAPATLSPDGRQIVFGTYSTSGQNQLWVRSLDHLDARPLPGTSGAVRPFWSPDSRFIGFFANGKLKKMAINGGPALSLANAPDGRGGTWNAAGDILYSPSYRNSVWRVPASGGKPVQVTHLDTTRNEETHRYPIFLPDGRHFLYLVRVRGQGRNEQTAVYAADMNSGTSHLLFHVDSNVDYSSGHLLFVRDRTLMAQPFDAVKLEFTGRAVPLAEDVRIDPAFSRGIFSVSDTGVLIYQTGRGQTSTQMRLFDATGEKLEDVGETGQYPDMALSPDGARVAVTVVDPSTSNWDIWLHNLQRGVRTRLTFDASIDCCAVWSSDGSFLVFNSDRTGHFQLYRKAADGSGSEQLLTAVEGDILSSDISRDGHQVLYAASTTDSLRSFDLMALSLEAERDPVPVVDSTFDERWGAFSPDGHWIAYTSDESGREEVYIAPFPGPGGKWQVTTAGGTQPRWKGDQTALFFLTPGGEMVTASVNVTGSTVQVGTPHTLFTTQHAQAVFRTYDVSADGSRFLINTALQTETNSPLTLVLNWTAGLPRE